MSTSNQSTLPLPDAPGVGDGWELLTLAEDAPATRRCTGARFVGEERERILEAAATLGTRRAAEKCGVSREVVRALKREAWASGKLDQLKEGAGRRVLAVADSILDRIEDEVDSLPKASLPLAYAILLDKGQLLTGAPTARVEITSKETPETFNDWLGSLVDVSPTPVGEENESAKKSALLGGATQAGDLATAAGSSGAAEPSLRGDSDYQSVVSAIPAEVKPQNWADIGRIESKKEAQS